MFFAFWVVGPFGLPSGLFQEIWGSKSGGGFAFKGSAAWLVTLRKSSWFHRFNACADCVNSLVRHCLVHLGTDS